MEIIVILLASLWSLGCVSIPLYFTYEWLTDLWDRAMGFVMLCIGFPLGCLLAALPWGLMADSKDPHIQLKKTEWTCMDSHIVPITTYVKSGNVMVPITNNHRVCDEYRRK